MRAMPFKLNIGEMIGETAGTFAADGLEAFVGFTTVTTVPLNIGEMIGDTAGITVPQASPCR